MRDRTARGSGLLRPQGEHDAFGSRQSKNGFGSNFTLRECLVIRHRYGKWFGWLLGKRR